MARRLSAEERAALEALAIEGLSAERIGRALGRCASTVRRELARGGGRSRYCAVGAQAAADARAARPRTSKLAADPELAAEAAEMLAMGWSPHAVAARWRTEGRCAECAETIYAACYDPRGRRGLEAGAWRRLARRRRRRKPRGRCEQAKRGPLGDIRPLSERPAAASERSEAGHWEGDLIIGEHNRSAVVTLVERVPDAARRPQPRLQRTKWPPRSRLRFGCPRTWPTLTWDQGREMARWPRIDTGLRVFFCEPHSPWQRPTNEQQRHSLAEHRSQRRQAKLWAIEDSDGHSGVLPSRATTDRAWSLRFFATRIRVWSKRSMCSRRL